MRDLSRDDCNLCFAQCKTQILRCLPFQLATRGGRLFFDGCYLRYEDYDFFNETLTSKDRTVCGSKEFGGNKSVFRDNAVELVRNLSKEAVRNDGFFVGSVSRGNVSVFGLAQCWEPVRGIACEKCLSSAVVNVSSCTPMEEGRVLNAGCYLRYSTHRFYNNSQPVPPLPPAGQFVFVLFCDSNSDTIYGRYETEVSKLKFICFCLYGMSLGSSKKLGVILGTTSAVAFLLIVGGAVFFFRTRIARKRRGIHSCRLVLELL